MLSIYFLFSCGKDKGVYLKNEFIGERLVYYNGCLHISIGYILEMWLLLSMINTLYYYCAEILKSLWDINNGSYRLS